MTPEEQRAARDEDTRCKNCWWWDAASEHRADDDAARCRKLPPTADASNGGDALFPMTEGREWCGGFLTRHPCGAPFGGSPLKCFRPAGHTGEHG